MYPVLLSINPGVIALMIPIVSVITFGILVITIRGYMHRERLSMMEHGMNPKDLKTEWTFGKRDPYRFVRTACTAIGVGVGLFLGNLMRMMEAFDKGGIVAGMICICGGLGLLVGYFLQLNLAKNNPMPKDYEDGI
jgi:hypothetical protein